MSHSTLIVIGPNVEAQLEPFNEELSVDPYWTQEAATPKGFWAFDGWVEEGKLAESATMTDLLRVLVEEYGDEDKYRINPDTGALERESTYNPQSKWDWYVIGGRWRGFFTIKLPLPLRDKFVPVIGDSGAFGNEPSGDADQLLKGQIDWEAMRDEAAREAGRTYDKLADAIAGIPGTPTTWKERVAKHLGDLADVEYSDMTPEQREEHQRRIQLAREENRDDPFEQALSKAAGGFHWGDLVEEYHLRDSDGRQKCVDEAIDGVCVPFAVLHEGTYYEKGHMGWFGMASGEMSQADWNKQVRVLFDSLPDDTLLTLVDVHI